MTTPAGWDAPPPQRRSPANAIVTPFTWLARTHATSASGDAVVALSLAGSLFFDISPDAARSKVALYLLLTMAPFAIVAPVLGPALDRMQGGRRLMVIISCGARAVVALLLVAHIESLLLFPEAFLFLVFSRAYAVSKSALVPTVVKSDADLVEANSKLGLLAGLAGFVAVVPAAVLRLIDVRMTLIFAAALYLVAALMAVRLPRDVIAPAVATSAEKAELRSAGVMLAASSMAVVRATVGFLTFQLAFFLRSEEAPLIWFGVVLVCSALGTMVGNALGPMLRKRLQEERMLEVSFVVIAVGGLGAAVGGGYVSASLLAGAVGLGAAFARLAFDAIVQRDAPDANRGRAFAQFETKFQMAWVIAAFVPVVITIPREIGFMIITAMAAFALGSYVIGWRRVRAGQTLPPPLTTRVRTEIRRRRQGGSHPQDQV